MKRVPEDFKMNVLLPGAVWLLVSLLAGCIVVARMEANAITVILFIVVTLVVFAVPMAIYMEYRGKIEEYFSWHNRKSVPSVEIRWAATKAADAAVRPTPCHS